MVHLEICVSENTASHIAKASTSSLLLRRHSAEANELEKWDMYYDENTRVAISITVGLKDNKKSHVPLGDYT